MIILVRRLAYVGKALVALSFLVLGTEDALAQFTPSGNLEIHYINVGQGGCTLIIGPNGTRILYDFGKSNGSRDIVPYLRDKVGLQPAQGIHFAIVSHRDTDHYVGYRGVVEAGYDVLVANYGPGSPKVSDKITKSWLAPAKNTTAGPVRAIPVGLPISLGNGAEALVVAANGVVYGDASPVSVRNENDRSIALYITHGNFQYVLDGDLGAGRETCTSHQTTQVDVQTRVAQALINLKLMNPQRGVDVLHIAHHGSESSTSAAYYNLMVPEVGLISVGINQGNFLHPRVDVVDGVLLSGPNRAPCVTAPPLQALYQTEHGKEGSSSTGSTSFLGKAIGDIKLVTDGRTGYTITGNFEVHVGSKPPARQEQFPKRFPLDEG